MPDRDLERELRELGATIDYPPTPDVARATRNLLDEEAHRSRRFRLSLPALRWAAVAAASVLIVAVPTLSPGLRATVRDLFVAQGTQMAGKPAVDSGSSERESGENAPNSEAAKGGEVSASQARAPRFSGERITLREARDRMGDMLLLPHTPKLGKPDVYAFETSRKDGVMLVYREGPPPAGETVINLILSEVPGNMEAAYLGGRSTQKSELDRVMVDESQGYWSTTWHPPSQSSRHLPGNLLLWEKKGLAFRLEADLREQQAVRIAESVR
jgi:hypothetical protein